MMSHDAGLNGCSLDLPGLRRRRLVRIVRTLAVLNLVGSPLTAQVATSITATADVITPEEIARRLRVLASDSMRGRDISRPSLERAATYLADELKRFASRGPDTTWIQRYPIPGNYYLDWAKTSVVLGARMDRRGEAVLAEHGEEIRHNDAIHFGGAALPATDLVDLDLRKRSLTQQMPCVLIAGAHTSQSLQRADLRESSVVYIPPAGLDSARERQIVDMLLTTSRGGVMVIVDEDSLTFARRLETARQQPLRLVDSYMSDRMGATSWGAYVRLAAVRDAFAIADVDVDAARAAVQPVVTRLSSVNFDLLPQPDTTRGPSPTAPNVVAILEGSDPKLKDEYVAFTAHLDSDPDGRDDNAAGIAGLLALTKVFNSPAARPKRSLIFLATSGATNDWWGARYFTARYFGPNYYITSRIVASLHLDGIDQIRGDSVAIDGLRDFANVNSPAWIGPAHPELGLTVIDGGSVDRSASNLGAYLVRIRPSLAFHALQGSAPTDRPSRSTAPEHTISRVLRLVFYMGYGLANADSRISLSAEGRRRLQQSIDGD